MPFSVYRLSTPAYGGDLSGQGSRLYGGRWNERGTPALYTATSVSLALLEVLVHVGDYADLPKEYTVTKIEVLREIETTIPDLPITKEASQKIGQKLLQDPTCLGFWVPSVVVPSERNLVLNPSCAEYRDLVNVKETFVQVVDGRLGR